MTKSIEQYASFLEIPEELYKRMVSKSNIFIISVSKDEVSGLTTTIRVGVTLTGTEGKPYFLPETKLTLMVIT